MYQSFYKLKQSPFRLSPDPAFICMTAQHREAFSGLVYNACTRPGLTVLIGAAGTGKTTLLYMLLGLLSEKRYATALCTNPTLTREEFFDFLLAKLGVECSSSLKSRQLIALQETLVRNRANGQPSVLIVDEAQRLSLELLEEIRLLLNLETPQEKLLEIIMAGQPELLEVLRRPDLWQLKQRVSCLCRLDPLSPAELREYIQHRLTQAGHPEHGLFSEQAIELVFKYSGGIPRLVNNLCDGALQTGFALQSQKIGPSIIEETAKDLDLEPMQDRAAYSVQSKAATATADTGLATGKVEFTPPPPPLSSSGNGRDATPLATPAAAPASENGKVSEDPVTRQKSLGFLTGLLDRWR